MSAHHTYGGVERLGRGRELFEPAQPPAPADWSSQLREEDVAYRLDYRITKAGDLAIRAAESVRQIHDYINRLDHRSPALEAELRRIEQVLAHTTAELLYRYMERP